jgi:hypothetical protein
VTAFTSSSVTTDGLAWGKGFSMNMFIQCNAISFDRRFKQWAAFQTVGMPTQCTSASNCANLKAQCDLDSSTECSGWNPDLNQGFYAP